MDLAAGIVGVTGETSITMGDTVPIPDESFGITVDSEEAIDVFECETGTVMPAVDLITTSDAGLSQRSSSRGYSTGRFAMISPACNGIGIELTEPDHFPDLKLWKAIRCSCKVSVEAHSR